MYYVLARKNGKVQVFAGYVTQALAEAVAYGIKGQVIASQRDVEYDTVYESMDEAYKELCLGVVNE